MQVTANGISINYELEGPEGAPCVTLSNSLACNLTMWDDQVAALKDRYRVLRYDQRGHGGTEVTEGAYTFDMLIADAVGLWDALAIEKSHWVGLSLGGMAGYGLAVAHPDRVLSMTFCDSRADAPPAYADYFAERIRITRDEGMEGLVEPTVTRWFTDESMEDGLPVIDKMRDMIRRTNPVGHIGCCEAIRTLSFGSVLGRIAAPSLVIGGEGDMGAPPEVMAEVAAAIPGAAHQVIPEAGHISNVENPGAFNDVLAGFLAANPGG